MSKHSQINNTKCINKMTFKELRAELAKCKGNPTKETAIRKLMYLRYCKHQLMKQARNSQDNNMITNNIINNTNKIDEKTTDNFEFNSDDFNGDSDDDIIEYSKDLTNNHLMDRLNGDLEIKKIKRTNKEKYIPPYSNTPSGNYATLSDFDKNKKNSFCNPKPIK